ncbi:SRPBCC family protein [Actinoplanes sp. NPDC049118]|uniref:type II toxin-antitoxin system RatA family toxin n=1 Tax=Actinoplanes sp. NPDC049118 TaxID=3155769 RepID=UPI0033E15179
MPQITIAVRTPRDPADVYERIRDFARYPQQTDAVVEVLVHPVEADGGLVSEWTVRFRNGLLRWTERDVFDDERRSIVFEQLSGDFATFRGRWLIDADGDGATIVFDAEFDLGIPTLAALIDPVAEATLRSNILLILRGLLGDVTEHDLTPDPPVGAGVA